MSTGPNKSINMLTTKVFQVHCVTLAWKKKSKRGEERETGVHYNSFRPIVWFLWGLCRCWFSCGSQDDQRTLFGQVDSTHFLKLMVWFVISMYLCDTNIFQRPWIVLSNLCKVFPSTQDCKYTLLTV